MKRVALIVTLVLVLGLVIQAFAGFFPVEAFAFPVNAAVLSASLVLLWVLHREKPDSALCRFLASGKTSVALIAAFLGCCLILGFTRQNADASSFPGFGNMKCTWWFILVSMLLMANLFAVLLSRRKKGIRFWLNHAGVFLSLAGCFFGAPDHSVSKFVISQEPMRSISLDSFSIEQDAKGNVKNYSAVLDVEGKKADLRVNHPYRLSWAEDIYLISYDRESIVPQYCVVEIVRQPWKYLIWTGIVMMMAGSALMFLQGAKKKEDRL